MAKGRYGGPERRRSPRHDRRFRVLLEYEGETSEIRTIDISEHGVLIPRRIPPPVGTKVKLILTVGDETSGFEGVVVRHTKCLVQGVQTVGVGIDFSSAGYRQFVREKISVA
ncbi:MAG TPA: PilZ domain-containing protein [Thermodesulfovibrionales bacterium]|nr:PilZ domain-containing protein [Thermodesulfovibrionales bacterium]